MSIDRLAELAEVDVGELLTASSAIRTTSRTPAPLPIGQDIRGFAAQADGAFGPHRPKDLKYVDEAIAMRHFLKSVARLTDEEQAALDGLIAVLTNARANDERRGVAKGIFLKARTAADIDERIGLVLDRLGNPEPPLNLEIVRSSLKLDFGYSRPRRTWNIRNIDQVLLNPMLLVRAVRKLDLRALFSGSAQILLDKDQPVLDAGGTRAHEVGRGLLPWHQGAMLGDDDLCLIPACHAELEAEANFAAAKLLPPRPVSTGCALT